MIYFFYKFLFCYLPLFAKLNEHPVCIFYERNDGRVILKMLYMKYPVMSLALSCFPFLSLLSSLLLLLPLPLGKPP